MKFLPLISPPLRTILSNYLKTARLALFAVLVTTILGTIGGIAAPYLFFRLIDQLAPVTTDTDVLRVFMAHAAPMGAACAFQRMSSFLTFMTSERRPHHLAHTNLFQSQETTLSHQLGNFSRATAGLGVARRNAPCRAAVADCTNI